MLTGPPPKFQEGEHPIAASASSSAAVQVGVELAQQRRQLDTHGGLDLRRLVQVGVGEDLAQPVDVAVEVGWRPALTSSGRSRAGVSRDIFRLDPTRS